MRQVAHRRTTEGLAVWAGVTLEAKRQRQMEARAQRWRDRWLQEAAVAVFKGHVAVAKAKRGGVQRAVTHCNRRR
jgi:hypothetical protein